MGVGKSMKRKFSFTNLTGKKSAAQPAMSPRYDYDDESPPYSPTPSEMQRPAFTQQELQQLKQACAVLVAMTNPPDPDDEPDTGEYLRRLEAERKAKHDRMRAAEHHAMKADLRQVKLEEAKPKVVQNSGPAKKDVPRRYSTRRPRHNNEDASSSDQPKHYVPKNLKGKQKQVEEPVAQLPAEVVVGEPLLPPVHAPIVERIKQQQQKVRDAEAARQRKELVRAQSQDDQALGQIRKSLHMRPKTSAAACVDYEADPVIISSNSTSRSNSDYAAARGRPISTGMTSLQAHSPSMPERKASNGGSPSGSMKEIHDLARQRADEYCAQKASRPASRQSKLSRMASQSDLNSLRPSSRAGSFASSIAENINNYIRNRHNTPAEGSIRSGRSSAFSLSRSRSRSRSRGSSIMSRRSSSSGWWRNGGLRRRGSWASFRSGGGEGRERNKLRKDGGPNLNRPLPALPGLDQYKEAKTHIGQLVKKKKVKKNKIGEPQPLVPIDAPYVPDAHVPPYCRSNSNLGHYGASSAPLPDTDGTEKEFPRFFDTPSAPEAAVDAGTARRSTEPETNQAKRERGAKMKRSSLNPVKPRRGSVTADTRGNEEHIRRLPPPMIRGPSYTKELEKGIFPRRMDVNDGAYHAVLYDQAGLSGGRERAGAGERADSPCTATSPPHNNNNNNKNPPPGTITIQPRGDVESPELTALPWRDDAAAPPPNAGKKEKKAGRGKRSRSKGLGFFGGGGPGSKERERARTVVAAN